MIWSYSFCIDLHNSFILRSLFSFGLLILFYLISTKSDKLSSSPVTGHIPTVSIIFSILSFSKTCPDFILTTPYIISSPLIAQYYIYIYIFILYYTIIYYVDIHYLYLYLIYITIFIFIINHLI